MHRLFTYNEGEYFKTNWTLILLEVMNPSYIYISWKSLIFQEYEQCVLKLSKIGNSFIKILQIQN